MIDGDPKSPSIRKLLAGGILCNGELLSKLVRLLLTTFVTGMGVVAVKSEPPANEFIWVQNSENSLSQLKFFQRFYLISQVSPDLMMGLISP